LNFLLLLFVANQKSDKMRQTVAFSFVAAHPRDTLYSYLSKTYSAQIN
jgi:hypothetical protein